MKVYTGGGDKGKTSLFSGERVEKHSSRIAAYGDLDELNSVIGVVLSMLPQGVNTLEQQLQVIQARLFQAGAWLATTPGSSAAEFLDPFPETLVKDMEKDIDQLSDELPPLKVFILPGGHTAASMSHVGRTVCRRCERKISQLLEEQNSDAGQDEMKTIQVYINRLSDYLFTVARYINFKTDTREREWQKS
ncbi:cob(I)yrinic acid a,c-diamide adenosyltransferase [Desulfogranum japonicum]|uniref:cob(I)yrinic acid a,c-diamide adenosyltransferase n=1 Tax=Desulfogranum japonicum TaxID=231447 RepID=UPI0004282195|nr:cob(I)yrinic acid a,c-diamide adenosyltransferase [Desulfogranum japonicum]